jgi:peptidoglycan/xylan/chitin deacetylase (PgdA/CDA1 family)
MSLRRWYAARGARFVCERGTNLLDRYGISPAKAIRRLDNCVEVLAGLGCKPTFPTPGTIVQRYPQFIRRLQSAGAEIAVHGYHHVDLSVLPVPVARQQLERAIRTFEGFEIDVRGFRCPYLGWSEELRDELPAGMFDYSSNEAICCEPDSMEAGIKNGFFRALYRFYQSKLFSQNVCLPSIRPNLIEIPVCVPDDLQLHDGIGLGTEGVNQVWGKVLDHIYDRGELFTLTFHPELASFYESSFRSLLVKAGQFPIPVWITRLRDISEWWREKSKFTIDITPVTKGLCLNFNCTPRATILVRGLDTIGSAPIWVGAYHRLQSNTLEVPANPRPFIGIADNMSERVVSFLHEQGYILESGETARFCGLFLDADTLAKLPNDVELVNYIESSQDPLVRFWRWPNGAKSALSITGDLDALSLMDYASRFLTL